jgi:ribonuclease HI
MSSRTATDEVTVYTDGGASPNPGPGGWGVVLLEGRSGRFEELSGGEEQTTNNRMELTAAIRALESLERPCRVELYTDSQYLRRGITEWLPSWVRRGWRRKEGEIQNLDLWKRLAALDAEHDVRWHWVKGHAGNEHNERADALARQEIVRRRPAAPAADIQVFLKITCRGGLGAWVALVRSGEVEETVKGRLDGTTANRLDLHAATETLRRLPAGASVALITGSEYLRRGASQWIRSWRQRGWKTKEGQRVKNVDAWKRLAAELGRREVVWPPVDDEAAAELKRLTPVTRELLQSDGGAD